MPLREIWKYEASNFTQWLALPENLELLSEEIDIELSVIATEYNVGRFNVDIFAEESGLNRKVIIENQLERTDHDHLGKLITYASGLDAEIIIWSVKEVLEEHERAIDWLNENTDEKINFFIVRMEVWKIGSSEPAPNFHIVCQPNNWAKAVKSNIQSKEMTPLKQQQLRFWEGFRNYCEDHKINLRLRKVRPQHWYDISMGRQDAHLCLTLHSQKNLIGCEIYMHVGEEVYPQFLENKAEIDRQIEDLVWQELPNKKASRIRKYKKADFTNEKNWQGQFEWLSSMCLLFQRVFTNY